jgi:chromate transporter
VLIATLAAVLFAWQASPFLVIVLAGLLAALIVPAASTAKGFPLTRTPMPRTTTTVLIIMAAAALAFLALWFVQRQMFDLAATMFRIDLFAFGGGFSSVPLMFHEAVEVRHWLDGPTLLNGIVLGQVTPGPIVITATFIGYILAGPVGGAVASMGVFLPSFLMLVATEPYFDRLRRKPQFHKVITGILCSFVGLLLTVTARFAQGVIWDWRHLLLAAGVFIALRLKVSLLWVILIGTGLSVALCR